MAKKGFSPKQEAFIAHYLRLWDGAKAARAAGYAAGSARQTAHKLLTNADIQQAIRARLDALYMTADEVLVRQASIARASMESFVRYEDDGSLAIADDGGVILDFRNGEARESLHLVKKIKRTSRKFTMMVEGVETPVVESSFEFELHDSQAAQVQLGKHHRLWVDRVDVTDWRREAEAVGLNPDELEILAREQVEAAISKSNQRFDSGSYSEGD